MVLQFGAIPKYRKIFNCKQLIVDCFIYYVYLKSDFKNSKLKEINSTDIELHEVYPPDVVIFLYDLTDTNSFSFVADIFLVIHND
jgi:hypothetical protein